MFARASLFALALPLFVAATAVPRQDAPSNQCNTGTLQCCSSVESATSNPVQSLLGLLGIPLGSVTGEVGLTCNPISVLGINGNSCTAQPACCTGTQFNGLVNLGCTPVNLNV